MRRPVHLLTLLVLLLLTLNMPTASAHENNWPDAVQYLGAGATSTTIGAFTLQDTTLRGHFVEATAAPAGLQAVHVNGVLTLPSLAWNTGTWHHDGPLAILEDNAETGALSLHDNEYGWITLRAQSGTATLSGTEAWIVDEDRQGATSGTARIHLDEPGTLQADGTTLTALFEATMGLAVTRATGPNIHDHAPRAGAWANIHLGASGDATADWMRVRSAPFSITDWDGTTLGINTVGTIGEGAEDLLVRLDINGLEPGTLRPILRAADRIATPATLEAILNDARGPFSFHATDSTLWLRLPAGLSGRVTLQDDRTDPTFTVLVLATEPWAPHERTPVLIANANEPGTATLRIGDNYEKRTVRAAFDHTFRLIGLQPDTDHNYTVTYTDLAGNQATQTGTFHAGKPMAGDRHINATAHRLGPNAFRIVANITDETGAAVTDGVTAFLDKQVLIPFPSNGRWEFTLEDLAPGTHEFAIEASTANGNTRQVLMLEATAAAPAAGADAPGPALVALLALLGAIATGARKLVPPQP